MSWGSTITLWANTNPASESSSITTRPSNHSLAGTPALAFAGSRRLCSRSRPPRRSRSCCATGGLTDSAPPGRRRRSPSRIAVDSRRESSTRLQNRAIDPTIWFAVLAEPRGSTSTSARSPDSSQVTAVDLEASPDDPSPSLQPHYRTSTTTTERSAPVTRITTLPLADQLLGVLAGTQKPQAHPGATGYPRPRADRFPRSTREPRSRSRHHPCPTPT
jgi:hypothetical protein